MGRNLETNCSAPIEHLLVKTVNGQFSAAAVPHVSTSISKSADTEQLRMASCHNPKGGS